MKTVSIVIPCRNEKDYIEKCLLSVLAFDIPADVTTEIFLADGMSTDNTINIIEKVVREHHVEEKVKILINEHIFSSYAINLALKHTNGDYILRLDAHALYPKNYLTECLTTLEKNEADNVGGLVITQPGSDRFQAKLVQALTTHKFGVGDSGFRVGIKEGRVDTVPYGFFNANIFKKIGFFDQRLVRAQDYEFNRRINQFGGKVWLNPAIQVQYFNQPDLGSFYKKQFYKEAPYNAYMWYLAPYSFTVRHAITGVFSVAVLAGFVLALIFPIFMWLYLFVAGLYFTLAILSAVQQAVRYKEVFFVILLPFSFFLFHFIHGLGLLTGIVKLLFNSAPVQKKEKPWDTAYSNNLTESVNYLVQSYSAST